jgi:hypothetical protein
VSPRARFTRSSSPDLSSRALRVPRSRSVRRSARSSRPLGQTRTRARVPRRAAPSAPRSPRPSRAGEIVALDSGGYGAVTIAQSVTIVAAPGVQASISPASGAAIRVNAGAIDTVVLLNLSLNAQGGDYGVDYQAGAALHIEALAINGSFTYGIYIHGSGDRDVHVADTVVRGSPGTGIYLDSLFGIARAIVRTKLEENGNGMPAGGTSRAYVRDSVASGNSATASSRQGPTADCGRDRSRGLHGKSQRKGDRRGKINHRRERTCTCVELRGDEQHDGDPCRNRRFDLLARQQHGRR